MECGRTEVWVCGSNCVHLERVGVVDSLQQVHEHPNAQCYPHYPADQNVIGRMLLVKIFVSSLLSLCP